MAPPFAKVEFDLMYGEGISLHGDIVDLGVKKGLVEKSGAWYSLKDGERMGQGRENAKQFLKDNPKICDDLQKQIREAYGLGKGPKKEAASNLATPAPTPVKAKKVTAKPLKSKK